MLTESDLQTPAWLAALVSGHCVVIRGLVGEHRLDGLKAIFPLGVLQGTTVELPPGEAIDAEFFASIMPSLLGELPKRVYVLPLVVSTAQIDALAQVRANQPWLQWVAVIPDPEVDPVLPDGILIFDAKARQFPNDTSIPPAAKKWAERVLGGTRNEEEKRHAVGIEGPRILVTANAIVAGEYQHLSAILGGTDTDYVTQLVTIASSIAGMEEVDVQTIAAEIGEEASIEDTITKLETPGAEPPASEESPPPPPTRVAPPNPQIFENGKALPLYPAGDPAGKYAREMDAARRDPDAHAALLEVLRELQCDGDDRQSRNCVEKCTDPVQKWACFRDSTWNDGMPTATVDRWLEMYANNVASVGRRPREAYNSFTNITLQASAANTTFSSAAFAEMVDLFTNKSEDVPKHLPSSPVSKKIKQNLPKNRSFDSRAPDLRGIRKSTESRVHNLAERLDDLVDRIEKMKERHSPSPISSYKP
ncbi:MAG: hypothetical protein RBG13Loki_2084 [Promethearchaeota archaeon CR_4]|nr:MAG: hypothetical protein RBG13Loki_2084 [Candidatus Lokiarchaeota archaeon CR_4]